MLQENNYSVHGTGTYTELLDFGTGEHEGSRPWDSRCPSCLIHFTPMASSFSPVKYACVCSVLYMDLRFHLKIFFVFCLAQSRPFSVLTTKLNDCACNFKETHRYNCFSIPTTGLKKPSPMFYKQQITIDNRCIEKSSTWTTSDYDGR